MDYFSSTPPALRLIAVVFTLCLFVSLLSPRNRGKYPGPPGWPLIGNLLDLRSTQPVLSHPGKTFLQWGKKYGISYSLVPYELSGDVSL
jgi:hypothetical protein